jgi:hypothetical protein
LPNYNKAVQIGRTVLNFSVKANSNRNVNGGQLNDKDKKTMADHGG